MNKILSALLIYCLTITSVMAGLPPTTLSGQDSSTRPTTFNFKTPYNQSTVTSLGGLIETGSENMLVNGGMEGTSASGLANGWSKNITGGAYSIVTASADISSGKQAQSVVLTGQSLQFYQSVNTPTGIQKQGVVGGLYRVPSAITNFRVCSLVDGATQTCVPSTSLITDGAYHWVEIPVTFGATSAGIQFETTAGATGTVYFDAAYVKQGIGLSNLQTGTEFSLQASTTGVVSSETGPVMDWVNGNAVVTGTSIYTFTLNTGVVTAGMNCVATGSSAGKTMVARITSTSSTTVVVSFENYTGTVEATNFHLKCGKTGNDYLASSSQVYTGASANTDWASYTPTLTNIGTTSPATDQCKWQRSGGDLLGRCFFTTGTVAGLASVGLPNGLVMDTSKIIATNTTAGQGQVFGEWEQTAANFSGYMVTAAGTDNNKLYFGAGTTSSGILVPQTATYPASSAPLSIKFSIPIAGWSNQSQVYANLAGTPKVPGADGSSTPNIDTFSVSYGTTNATTVCSASPCSYLDQIGTAVSSITRSGVGAYTLNLTRAYSKLKCVSGVVVPSITNGLASNIRCESCSTTAFTTTGTANNTQVDAAGTIMCQGSY